MLPAERWIRAATLLSALLCALLPSPGFFSAPGQVPRLSTKAGFQLSRLGVGTWQWGNKLLWGYDEKDDSNLREVFRTFTAGGSNWFDTGDSYEPASWRAGQRSCLDASAAKLLIQVLR